MMKLPVRTLLVILCMLLFAACASPEPEKTDNSSASVIEPAEPIIAEVPRMPLISGDLFDGFEDTDPVNEAAHTIPANAAPPQHIFEGRLELHGESQTGEIKTTLDEMKIIQLTFSYLCGRA